MNILICDDNKEICNSISKYINTNCHYNCKTIECYSGKEALKISISTKIQMLIIDIDLIDSNGINIANEIRTNNKSIKIILITAYGNKYYHQIYSQFTPHGYIDKPIQFNVLDFFIRQIYIEHHQNNKVLEITFNQHKNIIPLENIVLLQSKKRICEIKTIDKDYICYKKLSEIESELSNSFIRVHHSYIVNRNFIKSYDKKQIITIQNDFIPISRAYSNLFSEPILPESNNTISVKSNCN